MTSDANEGRDALDEGFGAAQDSNSAGSECDPGLDSNNLLVMALNLSVCKTCSLSPVDGSWLLHSQARMDECLDCGYLMRCKIQLLLGRLSVVDGEVDATWSMRRSWVSINITLDWHRALSSNKPTK